jgi:hypothetical protein
MIGAFSSKPFFGEEFTDVHLDEFDQFWICTMSILFMKTTICRDTNLA